MNSNKQQYHETPRLILRSWKEEDIAEFACLNSDEQVMEYFLKTLSYNKKMAFYNRIQAEFDAYGFGLYAVEKQQNNAFIGYVGLHNVTLDVDFAPPVEIG